MTPAPKNRIMIFGPKDDGNYVVEFKTAEGGALATAQRGARDPALPGADALRIVVPENADQLTNAHDKRHGTSLSAITLGEASPPTQAQVKFSEGV